MTKAAIIGDLHLSDRAVGRYIDYFQNCMEVCEQITNLIIHEGITHLFFAGDVVGIADSTNFKTQGARLAVIQLFKQWNVLCKNNVYSICGNHDTGSAIGDFEILRGAGLIKSVPDVIVGGFKFHLVDYGDDNRALDVNEEYVNIAITHSFFKVENQTNYIPIPDGVELSNMHNFKGVAVVANGHIHYPSNGYMTTSLDGRDISLLNLGSPTRPSAAETYSTVPVLICETTEKDGVIETFENVACLNLRPKAELYRADAPSAEVAVSVADEEIANITELNRILSEIESIGVSSELSYKEQLARFSNNNEEAVNLAYEYIEKAQAKFNGALPESEAKPNLTM
jgi:predicted phosphodiesterase